MSKIEFVDGKLVRSTKKQMEKYENKILNGYIKEPVFKRNFHRMARKDYIGHHFDACTKYIYKLTRLVLGNGRRRD